MLLRKNTCSRLARIHNGAYVLSNSFFPRKKEYPEKYTTQSDPHSNKMLYNNTEHIGFTHISHKTISTVTGNIYLHTIVNI